METTLNKFRMRVWSSCSGLAWGIKAAWFACALGPLPVLLVWLQGPKHDLKRPKVRSSALLMSLHVRIRGARVQALPEGTNGWASAWSRRDAVSRCAGSPVVSSAMGQGLDPRGMY